MVFCNNWHIVGNLLVKSMLAYDGLEYFPFTLCCKWCNLWLTINYFILELIFIIYFFSNFDSELMTSNSSFGCSPGFIHFLFFSFCF